jgi:hypothetical protein
MEVPMLNTIQIPADLIPDVRMGLFGLLGDAAEEISDALTRPRFAFHPEWFVPGRELLEDVCELLDILGWDGSLRPQDANLDFERHGHLLKAAVEGILPHVEMELAEVDANDARRAQHGEPPRRDSVKARMRALREFASHLERRSRT